MAIYLKLNGVKGQTQVKGHEDSLEVLSFQFGGGISVTTGTSNQTRTTDTPHFSEITLSRISDSATPQLLQKLAQAEVFEGKSVITFTREDKGVLLDLIVVTLTDVILSGLSLSSGGEPPSESLSLNYAKIELDYTKQKEAGGQEGIAPFMWNLSTNSTS
ncbi:type VI secretion system tube protein Hcp [Variovorax sp. KBW07]|uniref:Hcp family type VI secretion system effector n=1 Tax=Variovorax sp. KBW07 TaxID=2153358 RepID=UPI000F564852|nr:type VI secretion system tube protein Hcp [Variovorax sp. KBW07]RQO39646.1 type VI secretion system tube protein Hcp [Variovorax sp. KBW07]